MEIERDIKKRGTGKTVLVVDDNPTLRKMLAGAFLSDGFETCVEVGNGQEAIETVRQARPDLITLDFSMPAMNGLQAAPRLRKLCPETPIVLFSLYGGNVLQQEAKKAGVDAVLMKSEPVSQLLDECHRLLASKRR
jgi:CheY-like chemotaxis protein